jgi:hypothetical protein
MTAYSPQLRSPIMNHIKVNPLDPGSTSIKGTLSKEGGHKTVNAIHTGTLRGRGGEESDSSEYPHATVAMRKPNTAKIQINRRRLR